MNGTPELGPGEDTPAWDGASPGPLPDGKPDLEPSLAAPSAGRRLADWLSLVGPYLGLLLVIALFSYLTWEQGRLKHFFSLENLKLVTVHASVTATAATIMAWAATSCRLSRL